AGTGVWLVITSTEGLVTLFRMLVGVALIGLAWLMHPRFAKLDPDARVLEPEQAPQLYRMVGEIAEQVGAKPVWRITVSPQFNASVNKIGIRRRCVVNLGLPLWNLLQPQQRIAVLAHEMGHEVNGDLRRGWLVGTSLGSLAELYRSMYPEGYVGESLQAQISVGIAKLAARVASAPVL